MAAQQDTGIGFDLLQVAHAQVIPGVCIFRFQLRGSGICGAGQAGLSHSRISLSQAELNLNIARFDECGLLEVRNRLAEPFQLYVFKSKKQMGDQHTRLQADCMMKGLDRLLIFPDLVVHQAKVGLQFGNFRMKSYGLPVELGGGLKITPGLGILRRGQE